MSTINYINDKIVERHNVLLKLLNRLLENMGMAVITEVTEFKEIPRRKLLTDSNNAIYEEMSAEIHEYYSKDQLKHAQRKAIKHYLILVIKKMCEDLFLNLRSTTKIERIEKKKVTNVYYDIVRM